MIVNITGCFNDGNNPQRCADVRRQITFPRGASVEIVLDVFTSLGPPYSLAGATVTMTVKRRSTGSASPWFTKTGVVDSLLTNRVRFNIVPTDTKNLEPGRLMYDVWSVSGEVRNQIVLVSPLVLTPSLSLA